MSSNIQPQTANSSSSSSSSSLLSIRERYYWRNQSDYQWYQQFRVNQLFSRPDYLGVLKTSELEAIIAKCPVETDFSFICERRAANNVYDPLTIRLVARFKGQFTDVINIYYNIRDRVWVGKQKRWMAVNDPVFLSFEEIVNFYIYVHRFTHDYCSCFGNYRLHDEPVTPPSWHNEWDKVNRHNALIYKRDRARNSPLSLYHLCCFTVNSYFFFDRDRLLLPDTIKRHVFNQFSLHQVYGNAVANDSSNSNSDESS